MGRLKSDTKDELKASASLKDFIRRNKLGSTNHLKKRISTLELNKLSRKRRIAEKLHLRLASLDQSVSGENEPECIQRWDQMLQEEAGKRLEEINHNELETSRRMLAELYPNGAKVKKLRLKKIIGAVPVPTEEENLRMLLKRKKRLHKMHDRTLTLMEDDSVEEKEELDQENNTIPGMFRRFQKKRNRRYRDKGGAFGPTSQEAVLSDNKGWHRSRSRQFRLNAKFPSNAEMVVFLERRNNPALKKFLRYFDNSIISEK